MSLKFAHIFARSESVGSQYLFVDYLGNGVQSFAQKVLHLQSGEFRVRKVSRWRFMEAETRGKDSESEILTHLQEDLDRRGLQPNIVQFYNAVDVLATQTPKRWSRESYFRFYNGGDLKHMYLQCVTHGIAPPCRLITRMAEQIAFALHCMYTSDPPVFHNDLNMGNIFLHWDNHGDLPDFYIGDFGLSDAGITDYRNTVDDVLSLSLHVERLAELQGDSIDETDAEMRPHLNKIIKDLRRMARPLDANKTKIPDLTGLLGRSFIPISSSSHSSQTLRRLLESDRVSTIPRYYDTAEQCIQAHRVHGPWAISHVRVDPKTGRPIEVLKISDRTYHRPNLLDDDSDTDISGESF